MCVCVHTLDMANNKAKVLKVRNQIKTIIVITLSSWWPYAMFQVGTPCVYPLSSEALYIIYDICNV